MLKVKTKSGVTEMVINGSVQEILADIGVIVRSVWQEYDGEDREYFKHAVKEMVNEGLIFVSDEEVVEEAMNHVPGIVRELRKLDKDNRKKIMDKMPDYLLAEVISEVMKDVD